MYVVHDLYYIQITWCNDTHKLRVHRNYLSVSRSYYKMIKLQNIHKIYNVTNNTGIYIKLLREVAINNCHLSNYVHVFAVFAIYI